MKNIMLGEKEIRTLPAHLSGTRGIAAIRLTSAKRAPISLEPSVRSSGLCGVALPFADTPISATILERGAQCRMGSCQLTPGQG